MPVFGVINSNRAFFQLVKNGQIELLKRIFKLEQFFRRHFRKLRAWSLT